MRIALLISGGGTTALSILTACQNGRLKNVSPALVIASSPDAEGIQKLKRTGLKASDVVVILPKNFGSSLDFGEAILKECENRGIEFVGQYGWLCKTPNNVIEAYKNMMVNQHPGPLDPGRPDFGGQGMYGKRVHQARLCFVRKVGRDFWSEATAQRVAVNFDEGAVLKRKRVPTLPGDTAETLQKRMLPVEHEVQIETLQDFADGTVKELTREIPLVLPEEEQILEECKREAIKMYPKG